MKIASIARRCAGMAVSLGIVVLSMAGLPAAAVDSAGGGKSASGVTAARLTNADPTEWLAVGRTYDEQRFSPLKQIDTTNVGKLGLAWFADFDTNSSGSRGSQTSIPIAVRKRRRSLSMAFCTCRRRGAR
jgi:glucose dehydrogenase